MAFKALRILFFGLFFSFMTSYAQSETDIEYEEVDLSSEEQDVSFAEIQEVPVFIGCEELTSNEEKKMCLGKKLNRHVSREFNINVVKSKCIESKIVEEKEICVKSEYWPGFSGGIARVFSQFKINKEGNVVDVKVRAPHEKLKREVTRVIKTIPIMIPGKQKGEIVDVIYNLPISLKLE